MTASTMLQPQVDEERRMAMVADLVCAFVGNNKIEMSELSGLIASINNAFANIGHPAPVEAPQPLTPAVPIKKSVTPDFIICLEDGKKFRSLKRHLGTLDLTPDEYRRKWGLPADYPMVAPNYSEARSLLAKRSGLGMRAKVALSKSKSKAANASSGRRGKAK